MFAPWIVLIALFANFAVPVLAVAAVVTYIRRNRQSRDQGIEGSVADAMLDGLEQVQVRLDAMNARVERIETALQRGNMIPPRPGEDLERGRLPSAEGDR